MKRWTQSKNNTQLWMWLVMEARFDAVKKNIAKEPRMWGPWIKINWKWSNRRWQEWLTVEILGIRELKWTGMCEFKSDDHYIYYCGQESHRRNRVAITVNKRVWNVVLGSNLKWQNDLCSFPRQTIQYYSNPSLCPNHNAEQAEGDWLYEDLHDLLKLTHKKDILFIIGDGNAKVGSQKTLE